MSFNIINTNYLDFRLSNNFNPKTIKSDKQGIGVTNTKRRLNLLFLDDFKLETNINDNIYDLYLKIPIR